MTIGKATPCPCGGECCSAVPVSEEEAERMLAAAGGSFGDHFVTTNAGTFTRAQTIPSPPGLVFTRCCLFDPASRLCTVYEARPRICREYDCHD